MQIKVSDIPVTSLNIFDLFSVISYNRGFRTVLYSNNLYSSLKVLNAKAALTEHISV